MGTTVRTLVGTAAFVLLVPTTAAAQHQVGVGWALQFVEWHSLSSSAFNGITFDYAYPLPGRWSSFSIVGDVGYTRLSIDAAPFERDLTITGGLRWTFLQRGRWSFSAEGLAGVLIWKEIPEPTLTGSDSIVGGGGGAHFRITRTLGARAQWHLWADRHQQHWWVMHRVSVSGVWTFGGR